MNLRPYKEDFSKKMLSERIRRGWSIEFELTTPNTKKEGDSN